jgi:hypothetical protein
MWGILKNKIMAILQANTLFQEVYDYEVQDFGGDPVATIQPSANESDYRSTSDNRRMYAFSLQLWVKRGYKDSNRNEKQAENTLTDLVDSVVDDFDRYFTLGQSSTGTLALPSGYQIVKVQATPSAWFYANREPGVLYRAAEVILRVEVDVDVFNI